MKRLLIILLLSCPLWATTYTVKAAGGGNYTTIQACATAMANGDTCVVYAGTYAEVVSVPAGGAGTGGTYWAANTNRKTITINPGDTVYVLGFTVHSYVKIDGFHIQNPSAPTANACIAVVANSTDYELSNNIVYACGTTSAGNGSGMIADQYSASTDNTTYGWIHGNTLSYSCSTSAAPDVCRAGTIDGDHHLIENNDISHVSDGFYIYGKHNVYRNNTFHDLNGTTDCGPNSGNCHIDPFQVDASTSAQQATQYFLNEGNTVHDMVGSNVHAGGLFQGESCAGACSNAINRFNVAYHIAGAGIIDDNSGNTTVNPGWFNVKTYNNSWIDICNTSLTSFASCSFNVYVNNSTGGTEINDLFYYAGSVTNGLNPYYCDSGGASSTCSSFVGKNNLAWCTGASCVLYGHTYQSGLFTSDTGNLKQDPLLTNYAGNNFTLSVGSPAIGGGAALTTVTSGCGTSSLVVGDPGFFQDGWAMTGVSADVLRINTGTTATISSINYGTSTITFTGSVACTNGDAVYLSKDSSGTQVTFGSAAPDIGGLPSGAAAPTATLTASPLVIKLGTSSTLSSTCTNSDSASIDQGVGAVAPTTDTVSVSPMTQTTYTLTCTGAGGSAQATATVSIGGTKQAANTVRTANTVIQ